MFKLNNDDYVYDELSNNTTYGLIHNSRNKWITEFMYQINNIYTMTIKILDIEKYQVNLGHGDQKVNHCGGLGSYHFALIGGQFKSPQPHATMN